MTRKQQPAPAVNKPRELRIIQGAPALAEAVKDGYATVIDFEPVPNHEELVDIRWSADSFGDGQQVIRLMRTSRKAARARGIAA